MTKSNNEKIVIIANSLSLGGAERISLVLAKWMASNNIDSVLITLNQDREKGYQVDSSIKRISVSNGSNLSKPQIIKRLRKELIKVQPTKVLVMGVPLTLYVMPAVIGLNIEVIVSERNDPNNFLGKKHTKLLSRFLMKFANGFIFQTEGAKNYYSNLIQKKSIVIPNPLMTDELPEPYIGTKSKRIVTAGRLVPQKNHKLLITAFHKVVNKYPEYTLTIYGNGSERPKLENLINELNLKGKVLLPGASNNLFKEIMDAELFVLSSDFEGMPNALIEAMALGIPCISTDCSSGGPRELIENMKNGILVPVNDDEKLKEAIELLLNDKELSTKIAKNALNVRKKLEQDYICNKWFQFLKGDNNSNLNKL